MGIFDSVLEAGANTTSTTAMAHAEAAQSSAVAPMTHTSDNQFLVGMAQIGAQIIQSQSFYNLGQAQISANLDLGRERMQTSLQIARLNYLQQMNAQEDRHVERMEEIDLRRYEIDHPALL